MRGLSIRASGNITSLELRFSLVSSGPDFAVPVAGARVMLGRSNGQDVFTRISDEGACF